MVKTKLRARKTTKVLSVLLLLSLAAAIIGMVSQSIFSDELLIFTDEKTIDGTTYLIKSDTAFGTNERSGCQSNNDGNCWIIKTINQVYGDADLFINTESHSIDNGAGGGNEAYPEIRTLLQTKTLTIPSSALEELKIESDFSRTQVCENKESFGVLRAYLVDEEGTDYLLFTSGEATSESFTLEKTNQTSEFDLTDSQGTRQLNLPDGNYQLMFYSLIGPSPCPGSSGTSHSSAEFDITSITINGQQLSDGLTFEVPVNDTQNDTQNNSTNNDTDQIDDDDQDDTNQNSNDDDTTDDEDDDSNPDEPQEEDDPFPETQGFNLWTIFFAGLSLLLTIALVATKVFVRG